MIAASNHTVLLKNGGTAVAVGDNGHGQCNIPALDGVVTYVNAAAGVFHTVLLKNDGTAVAVSDNAHGQCNIPASDCYTTPANLILQATFVDNDDHILLKLHALSGEERVCVRLLAEETISSMRLQIAQRLKTSIAKFDIILPNGELLNKLILKDPSKMADPFVSLHRCTSDGPPRKKPRRRLWTKSTGEELSQ